MCNFFTYIRYIQQGLVRQDGERPLVADRGGARERRRGAGRVKFSPRGWAGMCSCGESFTLLFSGGLCL